MKKLAILPALLVILLCSGCGGPRLEMTASVPQPSVARGEALSVEVCVENRGRMYLYLASSGTVLGAEPTLWMDTEDGRVFLNREIVAQTADMALIYLYRGEQIVREWDFYVGGDALPGSYNLTLTFRGEEVVIPDFIAVL